MERQLVVRVAGLVVILVAAVMAAEPEIDVKGYRVKVDAGRLILIGDIPPNMCDAIVYGTDGQEQAKVRAVGGTAHYIWDVQVAANGTILTNESNPSAADEGDRVAVLRTPSGKELWRFAYGGEYDGYFELAPAGDRLLLTGGCQFVVLDGGGRKLLAEKRTHKDMSFGASFTSKGDILVVTAGNARLIRSAYLPSKGVTAPRPLDSVPCAMVRLSTPDGGILGPGREVVCDWLFPSPTRRRFCAVLKPVRGHMLAEPCWVTVLDTAANVLWTTTIDSVTAPRLKILAMVSDRHIALATATCGDGKQTWSLRVLDVDTRREVARIDDSRVMSSRHVMEDSDTIRMVWLDDVCFESKGRGRWAEDECELPISLRLSDGSWRQSETVVYGSPGVRYGTRAANGSRLTVSRPMR